LHFQITSDHFKEKKEECFQLLLWISNFNQQDNRSSYIGISL